MHSDEQSSEPTDSYLGLCERESSGENKREKLVASRGEIQERAPVVSAPARTAMSDFQGCNVQPDELWKELRNSSCYMQIKPILLVVTGLPQCGKTEHLRKALAGMLHSNKTELEGIVSSDNEAMMPVSNLYAPEPSGLPYTELSAVILPHEQHPIYFETSKDTTYLHAIEGALIYQYFRQSKFINDYSLREDDSPFCTDRELDAHFRKTIKSLQKNRHDKTYKHEWQRKIQNQLTLINIWDIIGMNEAAFHFLPALWGKLGRSFMWLFFSVDRDLDELDECPSIKRSESDADQKHSIMPYRTRLRYLLREAMLAQPNITKGKSNCSIFGLHKKSKEMYSSRGSDSIVNGAISMGVDDIIEKEVTYLQAGQPSAYATLERKMDEMVFKAQERQEKIPLNFIFLRSVFYYLPDMFVTKENLRAKGKLLNIDDYQMDQFFELFSSGGSIIDLGLDFVIMKPMGFIKKLDDLFHPKVGLDGSQQLKEYGLLTTKAAKNIFERDFSFFLTVLTTVNLALKIEKCATVYLENKSMQYDDEIYYIPDVRTDLPDLKNYPNSLLLRMSINSSLCHMQVLFAKEFLIMNKNCSLHLKKSAVNITTFQIDNEELCLQYLGEVIEFHSKNPTKETANALVKACHEVMNTDPKTKYNFAIKCSEVEGFKKVDRIAQPHHVLPYKSEKCKGEVDNKWINTFGEIKIDIEDNRLLQFKSMSCSDIAAIAETLHSLSPEAKQAFSDRLQDAKSKTGNSFKISKYTNSQAVMSLLLWEKTLRDAELEEECSSTALANLLMELAKDSKLKENKIAVQILARKLDILVYVSSSPDHSLDKMKDCGTTKQEHKT